MDAMNGKTVAAHHGTFMKPTLASKILVVLLIIVSVLVIAAMGLKIFFVKPAGAAINSKEYQALFLTNGQVYFGKLDQVDASYVKLTDIYYLQTQQTVQPNASATSTASPQLSLAKLGNELHGPEDAMFVAHDQVLFWENLKDSGKVVQAIKSYKASQ